MEASAKHFESHGTVGSEKLEAVETDAGADTTFTCFQESTGECMSSNEIRDDGNAISAERPERGHMQYGCLHYRRRCRIRAPCCDEIFDCRHCHNEAMNSINVEKRRRHELPRHKVERIICSLCSTEQDVRQFCINCGVCMGKYFCEACKLFDDDTTKKQYHCNGCGICRIGGRENFFHCYKCARAT